MHMLLGIHIFVALSSLVLTTVAYIRLSRKSLNASYALVGATLITGTALVITGSSSLVHSCLTGLLYLGIVSFGLVLVRRQLAKSIEV